MKSKCYHRCCSIVWCKCDSMDFDCCDASLVPSASMRAPNCFQGGAIRTTSLVNPTRVAYSLAFKFVHAVSFAHQMCVALRCRIFHKWVCAASRVNLACVPLLFQLRDSRWRVMESSGCCPEAHLLQNPVPHVPPYSDMLWVYCAPVHSAIKLQYSS